LTSPCYGTWSTSDDFRQEGRGTALTVKLHPFPLAKTRISGKQRHTSDAGRPLERLLCAGATDGFRLQRSRSRFQTACPKPAGRYARMRPVAPAAFQSLAMRHPRHCGAASVARFAGRYLKAHEAAALSIAALFSDRCRVMQSQSRRLVLTFILAHMPRPDLGPRCPGHPR
jgi:hypothetical protein